MSSAFNDSSFEDTRKALRMRLFNVAIFQLVGACEYQFMYMSVGKYAGKDKKSHIFRHTQRTKHKKVNTHAFKIIGKGYRSNFARKISESLFIKKLKPDLNVQKESYKLLLFN